MQAVFEEEERRRAVLSFCSSCWKCTCFRGNASTVKSTAFMDRLKIFEHRQQYTSLSLVRQVTDLDEAQISTCGKYSTLQMLPRKLGSRYTSRRMWSQDYKLALHLNCRTATAPFTFPAECGGLGLHAPVGVLTSALILVCEGLAMSSQPEQEWTIMSCLFLCARRRRLECRDQGLQFFQFCPSLCAFTAPTS